ncbi:hypothetical protein DRE_06989 [Drechslerella stenobrocha 248]|uniref:Uncharacterized protein n=1 Tax=Drechslerella stenobrocha 248 TaxID=1043628 RepID=W7HM40_9PEZI|nr:hypothetical protein DRE_06989 [Drechslerella stenobrocha 248]
MACSNFASERPAVGLRGRAANEKRFSLSGGIEFLSLGHPSSTSNHQSKPSTDTSRTLVPVNSGTNKLRRRHSTKNPYSRINTKAPTERVSFNVSKSPVCDPQTKDLSSPSLKKTNPLTSFRLLKVSIMDSMSKDKAEKTRGSFLRKIFTGGKAHEGPGGLNAVTKSDGPKSPVAKGTGSDLRDIRFYLGNDSLKICRQLCRIQDEDEKNIHILSHRVGSLPFSVRQFDTEDAPHNLLVPATVIENRADEDEQEMMKVFMENFISMLPSGCDKISRKANPAGLVFRLLPSPLIPAAARYLGAAFWLWLCAIDDQIEQLGQKDFEEAIEEIKKVFNSEVPSDTESRVVQTSYALRDLVESTELEPALAADTVTLGWRRCFLDAIMEILYAFEGERPLLDQFQRGEEKVKLADWMMLRLVTISARPFMVLARASLGQRPALSPVGNTVKSAVATGASTRRGRSDSAQTFTPDLEWEDDVSRLEVLAQCAMGLENDILGWEKDHAEENILNSVEILFQVSQHRQSAMREMVLMHNYIVNQMCLLAETVLAKHPGYPQTPPQSPARTLFRVDTSRGPSSPPPVIKALAFPTPPSPTTPKFADGKMTWRAKSKAQRVDSGPEGALPGQVQYIMVLMGFIQGMAVWTSKAKRYAV